MVLTLDLLGPNVGNRFVYVRLGSRKSVIRRQFGAFPIEVLARLVEHRYLGQGKVCLAEKVFLKNK